MGSECETSDHTCGLAVDGDPTGRRQAEPTRDDGDTSQDKEVSGRGAPGGGGSPRTGLRGPAIRLEITGPRRQQPQAARQPRR